MSKLKAWLWTSGRFFAAPFFCGALLIGVVLVSGSLRSLNTWLAFLAGLFCMASGHMVNTWGDWVTSLDRPSERSVEKAYTAGCGLIAEGKMTVREAILNSLMWLSLGLVCITILAIRVGAIVLVPFALGWGTAFWYSFVGKFNWTHETALASGVVAAAVLGSLSTGTGEWLKAFLVAVPIVLIFCYAGLALDEWPDARQNLGKGVRSLAYKVFEYGYDLPTYIMLWVFLAYLIQFLFIIVGILKPLTALTLVGMPPAIGASVFLKPKPHTACGPLCSACKENEQTFRRAAFAFVAMAMSYPLFLLLGQVLG